MLGVILLATLTPIPIVVLALTGAGLMIVTNCLRADEALKSLEPRALLLLAAAIPMGHAMETTGLAQSAVDILVALPISGNPIIFVSLFYLMVNLLAQFISAKAVAVLFTPIALSLAASMGINPNRAAHGDRLRHGRRLSHAHGPPGQRHRHGPGQLHLRRLPPHRPAHDHPHVDHRQHLHPHHLPLVKRFTIEVTEYREEESKVTRNMEGATGRREHLTRVVGGAAATTSAQKTHSPTPGSRP